MRPQPTILSSAIKCLLLLTLFAAMAHGQTTQPNKLLGGVTGTITGGVAGITVYLDANNNSLLDSGELKTVTGANGTYSFSSVPPGDYIVRQVLPSGLAQTIPADGYGDHVTVASDAVVTGQNFTDVPGYPLPVVGTLGDNNGGKAVWTAPQVPSTVHVNAFNAFGANTSTYKSHVCTIDFGDGTPPRQTFIDAHIYVTPGTYLIKETIDGDVESVAVTVPASTRTVYYVDGAGSDSNSGLLDTKAFKTSAPIAARLKSNSEVLFKCGYTYPVIASIQVNNLTGILIGSYGTGTKPILMAMPTTPLPSPMTTANLPQTLNIFTFWTGSADITIENVELTSPSVATTTSAGYPYKATNNPGLTIYGRNLTFENVDVGDFYDFITAQPQGCDGFLALNVHQIGCLQGRMVMSDGMNDAVLDSCIQTDSTFQSPLRFTTYNGSTSGLVRGFIYNDSCSMVVDSAHGRSVPIACMTLRNGTNQVIISGGSCSNGNLSFNTELASLNDPLPTVSNVLVTGVTINNAIFQMNGAVSNVTLANSTVNSGNQPCVSDQAGAGNNNIQTSTLNSTTAGVQVWAPNSNLQIDAATKTPHGVPMLIPSVGVSIAGVKVGN